MRHPAAIAGQWLQALLLTLAASCAPPAVPQDQGSADSAVPGGGLFPGEDVVRRCPDAPQGDAAAHLALVEEARRNPSPENLARLETNEWTELWAVAARMGAESPDDDWPSSCIKHRSIDDTHVEAVQCFQQRWGSAVAVLAIPGVRSVSCSVCRVGDLAPLGKSDRLRSLFLSDTFIENPESLAALGQLEALTLQNTNLSNTAVLGMLSSVRRLTLRGHFLRDLGGLARMKDLRDLNLGGHCFRDISPVRVLGRLESLYLQAWNVRDLSALDGMTKLRRLVVFAPSATVLPSFAAMTELESLTWRGRSLKDISVLEALPRLREVRIKFHCVPASAIEAFRKARPDVTFYVGSRHEQCVAGQTSRP